MMDVVVGAIVPLLVAGVVLKLSLPAASPLNLREKLAVGWHLMNAILIHMFLDGFVGFLHRIPTLYRLYCDLDKRYLIDEPSVMIVSGVELFLMSPLCLLTVHAICQRKKWRHLLEIVLCVIQIFGTIVFAGGEIYSGFHNVPADFDFTFTMAEIVYFWIFFVVANPVWIVIPLLLIWKAWNEVLALYPSQPEAKRTVGKPKKMQ
ncbi:Cholestenol delta-isomerase [Balamuthia mandrillaris]